MTIKINNVVIIPQEKLIDAQLASENCIILIFKSYGYCSSFINVVKPLQDDIIDKYQFKNLK